VPDNGGVAAPAAQVVVRGGLMSVVVAVVFLVVVLLVSVGLHELGHLIPAKRFGTRVSQYMIGFGPTLWSTTKGETEYGVKAIPAGGYCRIVGMYPPGHAVGDPEPRSWFGRVAAEAREASAEEIGPEGDARAFYRLTTGRKLVVMTGGVLMNFLLAIVLLGIAYVGIGVPGPSTTISAVSACVIPDTDDRTTCEDGDDPAPGAAAGLLPGDSVVEYDGADITTWDQLAAAIRATGDEAVPIVVERDGERVELTVTPVVEDRYVYDDAGNQVLDANGDPTTAPVGFLGITPAQVTQRASVTELPGVVWQRTAATVEVVATLPGRAWDVLHDTITGTPRDATSIVGPVGLARFAGQIAGAQGDGMTASLRWVGLLELAAALNISLFAFNLIPLPPMDGGHFAAGLVEGARRQVARWRGRPTPGPLDTARLVPVAYGVFVLLGAMGVMLVWADIVNPVSLF
jgi:membrane-associated protease RseP (regulator of RpoE activity)